MDIQRTSEISAEELEYLKLLKPELQQAIEQGELVRAASFAKELARLRRKELQLSSKGGKR